MSQASPNSSPSRRRQTALAVIDAYNEWSMPAIMAFRSEDCIQQVVPKSLGREPMDNEAYSAFFSAMIPHFRDFRAVVNDVFEDEVENKAVVWASSTASTDVGPYDNEYMLALYFNEAGDKVTRFYEFVDSARGVDFFPRLREHVAAKEAAAGEKS